jgi:hypothetical protein
MKPMEPLQAASAFATIISLIRIFRQERGAVEGLDHRMFIEWLETHRHQEIKDLISITYHLQAEVDQLMRADHAVIIQKLDMLDSAMASLASRVAEFRPMVMKLISSADLPEQAISILKQLEASRTGWFMCKHTNVVTLMMQGGNITITDPKFVGDDVATLVNLCLLNVRPSKDGTPIYEINRNAMRLLESINEKNHT